MIYLLIIAGFALLSVAFSMSLAILRYHETREHQINQARQQELKRFIRDWLNFNSHAQR
jgi:hypothetical protein